MCTHTFLLCNAGQLADFGELILTTCTPQGWENLFTNLVEQKLIPKPVFGVWLGPIPEINLDDVDLQSGDAAVPEAGELTLGGLNSTRYVPPLIMTPVTRHAAW